MLTADRHINQKLENPNFLSSNLVFIDSQIQDYRFLISGFYPGIDVVVIPKNQDGLEVITGTLKKYIKQEQKLDAIHIFSHGSPGSLKLGDIFLNTHTIKLYKNQIQKWQAALNTTSNILLYGCNVAAGIGKKFVQKLHQLTKANIAASVNPTGAYPGDWHLGFTTGKITAPQVLKPEIMATYNGTLDTITVTNNNDSGTGSLRQAIADANPGDTIEFDSSLTNQTITLTSGQLEIDKDLTIDGGNAPNLTISGNNSSRIMDYQVIPNFELLPENPDLKTEPLIIKNLTFAEGKTTEIGKPGAGGAIRTENFTELIVENSTFINNTISGRGGGAIYSGYNSKATIINSKFDNNDSSQAIENAEKLGEHAGGAILIWSESELTIQGSEFTNNKGGTGGAINNLLSKLTVEDSIFKNNDSTAGSAGFENGHGGAIYTDGASLHTDDIGDTIRISNSLFEGNKAAGEGGALFLFGYPPDEIIVENSTIINNYVIEGLKGYSIGGGIRAGNAEFTLTNSTVANNLALTQGGGLWVGENATSTVINSTFSNNAAFPAQLDSNQQPIVDSDGNYVLDEEYDITRVIGGAMTLNVPTTITNSTFANNHAGWWGGAFVGDASATTTNSIYYNNTAGNPFDQANQTAKQLNDGGGNIQYPDQANTNDNKITANITVADPLLGELQEVDGVLVHPLLLGSPAIDAGTNTDAPTTDQLGNTRPVDGDNNGSRITDIGAVEFIPTPTPEATPEDCITGDSSDNSLNGTSDNDCIDGLGGNDTLKGAAGEDTINGGDGNDTLGGGAGNDQLNGDAGNDSLTGWIGDDIIHGGDGFDTLQGGDDVDTLNGGNDADTLKGGTGNDLLNGDSGNDFIQGEADDDELNGGDGQDTVGGGNGNDIINGNAGNDSLTGWWGDDTLRGGTGNDIVKGGNGLDILNGEQGTDTLTGGSNSDRFIFDIGSQFNLTDIGSDIITDFNSAESDKIVLDKTTFSSLSSVVGNGFSVGGEFAVVDNDTAAATTSAKVVYNSANGQLFYNPNGTTSGFGEGGLFATLENQANLQESDFVLKSNSTSEPTPATPAEITSDVIKFTPSDTEAEIAAKGGPSIEIGTQTIYIGTWQESSNNQDPIIASFDDINPANNWIRTDYESTGADGRGNGLFWDGDDLYAVFSTDGTQGSPSEDFRRAASDATQSWLRSYGQGGGAKVSVVARIDELTGEMTDAAFFSAVLNSGNSNTLTVTDLSINSDNNLVVEANAFFGPRNPDGSRMTQVDTSLGSPFDYTVEITQSLEEVISTAAVGWE
ncbi:DUF4347 domain-containing protein [Dapis sp. BLCC M126]|uniref:DUF4347 domain-containing protein n=1 Tax=Dapis sp. BLCC M126 TaxID=3400189 RepID=UPI003CEA00FB